MDPTWADIAHPTISGAGSAAYALALFLGITLLRGGTITIQDGSFTLTTRKPRKPRRQRKQRKRR